MVVSKSGVRHSQHYAHVLMIKRAYYFLEKKTTSVSIPTKILGVFPLELCPSSQLLPVLPVLSVLLVLQSPRRMK